MNYSEQFVELTEAEALSCLGGINWTMVVTGGLGIIGGLAAANPCAVAAGVVTVLAGFADE